MSLKISYEFLSKFEVVAVKYIPEVITCVYLNGGCRPMYRNIRLYKRYQ